MSGLNAVARLPKAFAQELRLSRSFGRRPPAHVTLCSGPEHRPKASLRTIEGNRKEDCDAMDYA
jgi:hypothetical protein